MARRTMTPEDRSEILNLAACGESGNEIARQTGWSRAAVQNVLRTSEPFDAAAAAQEAVGDQLDDHVVGILTADDMQRITSLEALVEFFKVDTSKWQVKDYRINKWEQASKSKDGGVSVTPLYQVRANLVRSFADQVAEIEEMWQRLIEDAKTHAPPAPVTSVINRINRDLVTTGGESVLFELAIVDPHLGMLAWGKEVGRPYDSDIAVRDYGVAVEGLLRYARLYPTERILFLAGNDFLHVDAPGMGGSRGGTTTAGTPQDVDGRLAKMFTTGRRALVEAIDRARQIAPVDVLFVAGNHDTQQTYRMGEVIAAWYRNDPDVRVIYGANKRHFYGYGKNAFLFAHGEEYKRQRDNLPMIFATECPPELWVGASHREIHTGHFHAKMEGRYTPTSEVNETRGIRTRALPGLTATDAWHHEQGYKHRRAATALAFRRSGGIAGMHEVYPETS